MPKRTKSYETDLQERLQDPAYAMEYLRAALEDDDEGADAVFLLALRDVAKANHMTYVAEATGLNREGLYKMLSRRGNPGLNSLKAVLSAVGLKLSVEMAKEQACAAIASIPYETPEIEATHCEVEWKSLANPPPCFEEVGAAVFLATDP
jgi:probable addiction module antidote protein